MLFEQAIAPAPLTLPAHSTLFTGLLPPRHGVRDNGGYVLDPKHTTLASALKDARPPDGRIRRRVRARRQVRPRRRVRYLPRPVRRLASSVRLARRASRARRARSWTTRCPGSSSTPRRRSSPGCTSTTPTRRTRRPNRSCHASAIDPYAGEIAYVDAQVGPRAANGSTRAGSPTAPSSS